MLLISKFLGGGGGGEVTNYALFDQNIFWLNNGKRLTKFDIELGI